MERIFRDERVPDVEIRNYGGKDYEVFALYGEPMVGCYNEVGWPNTSDFTRYPSDGCPHCNFSEIRTCAVHAEIAAKDHFDMMVADQKVNDSEN